MSALSEDIRYMHPNCSQIACCIFFPVYLSLVSHAGRYTLLQSKLVLAGASLFQQQPAAGQVESQPHWHQRALASCEMEASPCARRLSAGKSGRSDETKVSTKP